MSKRKNRSRKPNLPQATLDRARRQLETGEDIPEEVAALPDEDTFESEAPAAPVAETPPEKPVVRVTAASERRTVERRTPRREERVGRSRTAGRPVGVRRGKDETDLETIQRLLANPTKTVTPEQLREDYRYVIDDLKRVFMLVIAMVTLLLVLGLLI